MSHPVRDARRRIQTEHAELVGTIDACADAVAAGWNGARTTDSEAISDGLATTLEDSGVLETLPSVLADVVDATGYELRAQPVAAPPYVVVTSRGPMLRATIDPGRLVVRFDGFAVVTQSDSAEPATYRRQGVRVTVTLE